MYRMLHTLLLRSRRIKLLKCLTPGIDSSCALRQPGRSGSYLVRSYGMIQLTYVVSMLVHRLLSWSNIETTLVANM